MRIDYGQSTSDILTAVLNTLQFEGKVFCYSRFTAPWAIRLDRKEFSLFHFFERGEGWIELEETGEAVAVVSGDLVILPHGDAHTLRDSHKATAVNVEQLLACSQDHILRHGGGGAETSTVCGAFSFEDRVTNPILHLLPDLIHVPHHKIEAASWSASTLGLLAQEALHPQEGSGSIIGYVIGIIFIQAVRQWLENQVPGQGGWLGALRDKQIGAALSLMHEKPNEAWTIAKLASEVGMSRSPFATKFTSLVGEPPLGYLTRWRMNLATSYLRDQHMSIREIAERVGYESQASFTNAFKRMFAVSPSEYKEKHRTVIAGSMTNSAPAGAASSTG